MKRIVYLMIGVCLLTLPACGGSGSSGEVITKADDMLGVWHRTTSYRSMPQIYMQFRADGTMGFSRAADKWDYEWMSLECAFEGTRFSVSETAFMWAVADPLLDRSCTSGSGAPDGVYEIQLLANGNLKFANAQDNCRTRREVLALAEWEPVQ